MNRRKLLAMGLLAEEAVPRRRILVEYPPRAVVMLLLAAQVVSGATVEFQVGFAVADITPPPGWRRAGGFSEFISTAGGDPLLAKAMVLSQGDSTVAGRRGKPGGVRSE